MAYVVTGYWNAGYVTSDSQSDLTTRLQGINPGAIIELFQLELNVLQHGVDETYYFHAGTNELLTEVVWNGDIYQPFPIEADGFEYTGNGQLPRPTLRAANVFSTLTALILTLPEGLEGAKVTRIRTLARYLDSANFASTDFLLLEDGFELLLETSVLLLEDGFELLTEDGFELLMEGSSSFLPDGSSFLLEAINATADPYAEWPREIYYVDRKSTETRDLIEFELASAFDLAGVRAPKRQCVVRCQWKYRSAECSYTGTNFFDEKDNPVLASSHDVCGKRVDSCKLRFGESAELPFGGFPGIGTYFA